MHPLPPFFRQPSPHDFRRQPGGDAARTNTQRHAFDEYQGARGGREVVKPIVLGGCYRLLRFNDVEIDASADPGIDNPNTVTDVESPIQWADPDDHTKKLPWPIGGDGNDFLDYGHRFFWGMHNISATLEDVRSTGVFALGNSITLHVSLKDENGDEIPTNAPAPFLTLDQSWTLGANRAEAVINHESRSYRPQNFVPGVYPCGFAIRTRFLGKGSLSMTIAAPTILIYRKANDA